MAITRALQCLHTCAYDLERDRRLEVAVMAASDYPTETLPRMVHTGLCLVATHRRSEMATHRHLLMPFTMSTFSCLHVLSCLLLPLPGPGQVLSHM